MDRFLNFEEKYAESLMQFKVRGLHLWPGVRTSLYMDFFNSFNGLQKPHASLQKDVYLIKKLIFNAVARGKNPYFSLPKADMVFLTTARNRIKLENGKSFDNSYDYFVGSSHKRSLFLEEPFRMAHFSPECHDNIRYLDAIRLWGRVKRSFFSRSYFNEKNVEQCKCFASFLAKIMQKDLGIPSSLVSQLSHDPSFLIKMIVYAESLERIILRTEARIVSIHCCGYGGGNAFLAKKLKKRGIKVIEFQHGSVSEAHPAYNYSLLPHSYHDYLPDFFLTFGEYWSNISHRYPVKKVAIGKPFLESQLQKKQPEGKGRNKVLIVSQGAMTSQFVELTKKLRLKLTENFGITFRLHPGEIPFREDRCQEIESVPGIEIEENGDIYSSIFNHDFIVGAYSTVMFEALPFEKKIYIWDTELSKRYIPSEVGIRFKNADDLATLLLENKGQIAEWEYYWEKDWRKRFECFLENIYYAVL